MRKSRYNNYEKCQRHSLVWFYDIMFSRRVKLGKKKRILAIYKYDGFMADYYDWYFRELESNLEK